MIQYNEASKYTSSLREVIYLIVDFLSFPDIFIVRGRGEKYVFPNTLIDSLQIQITMHLLAAFMHAQNI